MFAVVLFEEENCVECVPVSWIKGNECYWPPRNAKRQIECQSMADTDKWIKYRVRRIGKEYEDYETARKYSRKAEETSSIESETSEPSRKRKLPSRFEDSESTGNSDNDSCSDKEELPSPPKRAQGNSKKNDCNSRSTTFSRTTATTLSLNTSKAPMSRISALASAHRQERETEKQSTVEQSVRRQLILPGSSNAAYRRTLSSTPISTSPVQEIPRISPIRPLTDNSESASASRTETVSNLFQRILSKIEGLENDITAIKSHLICTVDVDAEAIDSLLPDGKRLDSTQDIETFQDQLDDNSKQKLINALASLQGGSNAGEICRAIMRALLTNNAMSYYSGTGQKGKLRFIGTPLYKIILSAARKASKKTLSFKDIKMEVLDVLRNAPNKPGGTNYVKRRGNKSQTELPSEYPEESD